MDPQPSEDNNKRYDLPSHKGKTLQPLPGQLEAGSANPAADLIRQKLSSIYSEEPSAKEESAEAEVVHHRSKHQQFMHELTQSGKSLAAIQTEWHNYYVGLPDNEKHEVWQEFYSTHNQIRQTTTSTPAAAQLPPQQPPKHHVKPEAEPDNRTVSDVKSQILERVQRGAKRGQKDSHFRSLMFGLSMGAVVLVIFLFGFFNERFIAPFMTPSKSVSSTPLIIDPASAAVGQDPKLIIPKINVELPVVYDVPTIQESAVEAGLERGVVHYATTPSPGEQGNGVIFGHSSNNLFNKGSYKFAFVLLHKLEVGDTFFIEKGGKRYTYRIYKRDIVAPTAVEVLNTQEKASTFTLITCDPPGTSLHRLVVVGEQISPDPIANVPSHIAQSNGSQPAELPSNSPTLWSRFWGWISS